jgi:hypothetical protein
MSPCFISKLHRIAYVLRSCSGGGAACGGRCSKSHSLTPAQAKNNKKPALMFEHERTRTQGQQKGSTPAASTSFPKPRVSEKETNLSVYIARLTHVQHKKSTRIHRVTFVAPARAKKVAHHPRITGEKDSSEFLFRTKKTAEAR